MLSNLFALFSITQPLSDATNKISTTGFVSAYVNSLFKRSSVTGTNLAITASTRIVPITSIAASVVLTLPAASTFPSGQTVTIVDETGTVSAANFVQIQTAGTDVINNYSSITLNTANDYVTLECDGISKWTVISRKNTVTRGRALALTLRN